MSIDNLHKLHHYLAIVIINLPIDKNKIFIYYMGPVGCETNLTLFLVPFWGSIQLSSKIYS